MRVEYWHENRLEMGIGIIVACVPTIRPLRHSGLLESLQSRLNKSYPKIFRQRFGGNIDIEDQQRLQRIDSIENGHCNLSPGVAASITALPDKTIAKADSEICRSHGSPVTKPVHPRNGIVKTTDFQLSTLEHWYVPQEHLEVGASAQISIENLFYLEGFIRPDPFEEIDIVQHKQNEGRRKMSAWQLLATYQNWDSWFCSPGPQNKIDMSTAKAKRAGRPIVCANLQ